MTNYDGPDSNDAAILHPTLACQTITEDPLEFNLVEQQSQTSECPTNKDEHPMPFQHGQEAVTKPISLATASFSTSCSLQTTSQQSSMTSTSDTMVPPVTASAGGDRRTRILEVDIPTVSLTPMPTSRGQNSGGIKCAPSSLHTLANSDINRPLSPSNTSATLISHIVSSDGSVYAAVPISSELYIIPKTSRGFQWNGDLFLKPYQRRSLGIDHLYSSGHNQPYPMGHSHTAGGHQEQQPFGGSPVTETETPQAMTNRQGREERGLHHRQDSSVFVHEIHLGENAGILPLWP